MTATLVLTRPDPQARALADALDVAGPVIISPILEIVDGGAEPDLSRYAGVVLTSANAVRFAPGLDGMTAHCVGAGTAASARDAGAQIGVVAADADRLVAALTGPGPLLHLRGEHARGSVAQRLTEADIQTDELVVYRQLARPLTARARAMLEGEEAVVLPLYSPRSARLVATAVTRIGSNVRTIAMSPAVADAWREATGRAAEICAAPTGAEMQRRIETAMRR